MQIICRQDAGSTLKFGLDAETQQRDIEGIKHHLSPATVEILADLAGFFEKNPETLKGFLKSRKGGKP